MRHHSWAQLWLVFIMVFGILGTSATPVQASTGAVAPLFDTTSTSTRFVDVVVGDNHTCGLRANGT